MVPIHLLFVLATQPAPAVSLTVDAREITRGLYHVTETFAAKPGKLTLWFPRWIPGWHTPGGPASANIRFKISADGKTLEWKRDLVDMFQVTSEVPKGAKEVKVEFTQADGSGSAHLARVNWNALIWYPASPSDQLMVKPSLLLPENWSVASALHSKTVAGKVTFDAANLTRLLDSPAQIGRYYRQYDVTGNSKVKHYLDVMADTAEGIDAPPAILEHVRKTHEEMQAITGATHYNEYHWLLTLSDNGAGAGLEHHESSEDGASANAFTSSLDLADLLCHEYFHSFNGKFRRPIGLCTPDYQKPMKDDLLWVYEGMTQYMGHMLACRAGWWTPEQWRDQMALNYMEMNTTRGREWRPLEDTAAGVPMTSFGRNGASWKSARRGTDYYVEMTIVWLEVDMRIRQLTNGKRSLFDFQRDFHGGASKGPELKPYTFEDVVAGLNKVAKFDWAALLRERVYQLQPELSTKGFELAGWKLVYDNNPNPLIGMLYGSKGGLMLNSSIGLFIGAEGVIQDVIPGYPGDKAGLAPGMKLLSVNGQKYSDDVLKKAVLVGGNIDLVATYKEDVRSIRVSYSGGLRIPHLERIPGTTDRFVDLLKPLAK